MITQIEVMDFAQEWQLLPDTVEKDYVLGWLLAGFANHPQTSYQWVFKGGTCLKKCYFETYRFSEDLDFSLRDDALYDADGLREVVREVCAWMAQESGIELPLEEIRIDQRRNLADELPVSYPAMRAWHVGAPIEVIRFAGANRLCVRLTYNGKTRTVEPYSFRQSRKGDLSFYGWEWEDGHVKRFRLDRIQHVEVSDITFTPRYAVKF